MSRFRRWLGRLTGTHIFTRLPRGIELGADLRRWLPDFQPALILDVGANLGQSAGQFLRWFPAAQVICFEPVAATFAELERRLGHDHRIRLVRLALGRATGTGVIVPEGPPGMYRLAGERERSRATAEEVAVESLDRFAAREGITRVGLLKVDTEGHDLEVLAGASGLLGEGRVDLVMVEAGLNPDNRFHAPMEALKTTLEGHGYRLFGIYNQKEEWPSGEPHLRRADLVFQLPQPKPGGPR